jgi:hypothetical protein
MRTTLHTALLACGLTLLIAACSNQRQAETSAAADAMQSAPAAQDKAAPVPPMEVVAGAGARLAAARAPTTPEAQLQSAAMTVPDGERRFIRTASAQFRVRDVYRSALAIEDMAGRFGGFVTSNRINAEIDSTDARPSGDGRIIELATYTTRGALQVRVPSARTQDFLRELASQVEFLDNRNFAATDAQFELLRQKLAYARGQDAQRALGDVAAAGGRTSDRVDAVDARNASQAQRDEALIAQKTFEDRVAFSTIDLGLYQAPQVRRSERLDVEAIVRDEASGFFVRLWHGVAGDWYALLDVVVALSRLWPLWLLALAGLWCFRRRLARRPPAL